MTPPSSVPTAAWRVCVPIGDTQRRPSSTAAGSQARRIVAHGAELVWVRKQAGQRGTPAWPGSCMPPSRITLSVGITKSRARHVPSDMPLCSRWEMVESSPAGLEAVEHRAEHLSISREHVAPISARPDCPRS